MAAFEIPLNATVWPFPCNWRERVELTYEFLTTIFASDSGKEQRRARRQQPRLSQSVKISGLSENEQQRLARFVFEEQIARIVFPDYGRETEATIINNLTVEPLRNFPWVSVGAAVVIRQAGVSQLHHVGAVAANGRLTLTTATTFAGNVRILPAIYAHMGDDLSSDLLTDAINELDLEIDALPGFNAPVYEGEAGTVFDGREVLEIAATWADRTAQIARETRTMDLDVGRLARYNPLRFGTRVYRGKFVCGTRQEIDSLAAFFMRHRGRQKEFFRDTGMRDLTPTAVAGAVLSAQPTGQVSLSKNLVDRAVVIVRKGGEKTHHKVTAYAVNGATASLTLDPAPAGIAYYDIDRVSWLPLCRFASDRLTIPFETTEAAEIDLSIQTLQYLPAEN